MHKQVPFLQTPPFMQLPVTARLVSSGLLFVVSSSIHLEGAGAEDDDSTVRKQEEAKSRRIHLSTAPIIFWLAPFVWPV